jgi:hypothetical protein
MDDRPIHPLRRDWFRSLATWLALPLAEADLVGMTPEDFAAAVLDRAAQEAADLKVIGA